MPSDPPFTPFTLPGGAFVRPVDAETAHVGGKARSLARLARLGLKVPPAFAISGELSQTLRAMAPAAPVAR